MLSQVRSECVRELSTLYLRRTHTQVATPELLNSYSYGLDQIFTQVFPHYIDLMERLRRTTFTLTHVSEVEGIKRALGRSQKTEMTKLKINHMLAKAHPKGGTIEARVRLILTKLKHQLLNAFHLSLVFDEEVREATKRFENTFPKARLITRPRRVLKKLEAQAYGGRHQGNTIQTGFMDQDSWGEVVRDYLSDELPFPTFARTSQDYDDSTGERLYDWEMENDITQDFVYRVRDGQIDAANTNGITDFAWIAVLDKNTCEDCCAPRNGYTSTEIEKMLEDGDLDDECPFVVPPAHLNCRCVPSPVTLDMPDVLPAYEGSFEDWMQEKVAA